ncbi:MAG TPA: GNAT family N-acetyltransferase [Candidatus Polarisedimenticolia bacterium]|nr:GNAT family N-acetyltransferase [Candidatus Polarisedimenticolia bacterium]
MTGDDSAGADRIEGARAGDLPEIRALLLRCGLPVEGAAEHVGRFFVARDAAGGVVGCSGLEVHESAAVLRSLAVAPERRGGGLARRLIESTLSAARRAGCTDAYLLTHTVEKMAARYGFSRVPRDQVAHDALRSGEFSLRTCATAAIMHRSLISR